MGRSGVSGVSGGAAGVGARDVIDLTSSDARPGGWLLASTAVTTVDTGGAGRWRRGAAPGRPVPKGQKHAYRPSESVTACGRPLSELHEWNDRQFGDGLINRCADCVAQIRHSRRPALRSS